MRSEASEKDRVILLVEDNPDDEALTLRAFRKNNVSLDYLFATGSHAERDPGADPRLVLLDLKLPRIDGLEVLRRIRSDPRTRLLPVVILTSSKEQQDMLDGYGLGANSYVQKPVDFARFIQAVEQLKLYWLVLNEFPRGAA
jgi:two-component system response regulator